MTTVAHYLTILVSFVLMPLAAVLGFLYWRRVRSRPSLVICLGLVFSLAGWALPLVAPNPSERELEMAAASGGFTAIDSLSSIVFCLGALLAVVGFAWLVRSTGARGA